MSKMDYCSSAVLSNGMGYKDHIDGLRGFSVIAVIFCHLGFSWFNGGFVGVDVFFVISGYLITRIIVNEIVIKGGFDYRRFIFRRANRILPALLFMLIIVLIAGAFLFAPAEFKLLGGAIATTAVSVSNIYYYCTGGYFQLISEYSPLVHTWSLGVEEQFYIFWPFVILLSAQFSKKKGRGICISICILLVASFLGNLYMQNRNLSALYYLMPFRIFEFAIGALMIFFPSPCKLSNWFLELLCSGGVAALVWTCYFYDSNTLFPSYNALLPVLGSALIIYAGSCKYSGSLFRNILMKKLGDWSYSLYLIHWPIISFYMYYKVNTTLPILQGLLLLCVILISGAAVSSLIERPVRLKFNSSVMI